MAAPKSAIAKYQYVPAVSLFGTVGTVEDASDDQSGFRSTTATTKTTSASPRTPVTFSMTENFTAQTTSHTPIAASGAHIQRWRPVSSCSEMATPPISAL